MHYAIVTDLNRCVGCLACNVACKALNGVLPGYFWNRTLRVGPNPKEDGSGQFPDVEMYFLTMQCQHCVNPPCVSVCPTQASYIEEDGTVQIKHEDCIGCGACLEACPYGVRFLDDDGLAEKCTMCEQTVSDGGLPQCVAQCGGNARFFGDLDEGIESFEGAPLSDNVRPKLIDFCEPFAEDEVYALPDSGNQPTMRYILRGVKWRENGLLEATV